MRWDEASIADLNLSVQPLPMLRQLLFCTCLTTLAIQAQPVLRTGILPVAGTMYAYHDVPYMEPMAPTGKMRWNYASLPPGAVIPYQWSTTVLVW